MNKRRFLRFASKVISAQVTTYFLAGAVFYPLLTKPYFEGPNPILRSFCVRKRIWGCLPT